MNCVVFITVLVGDRRHNHLGSSGNLMEQNCTEAWVGVRGHTKDDEAPNKEQWKEDSIDMTGQGKERVLGKSSESWKTLRTTAGRKG